ncbi:cytochrome c [Labrenzia sp. PHM005]|uniref:c-type cytochrome n=1 Tax=Labrenzia sp. PHM005 TaxID=2590016 RepID=UPI001AD8C5AB|nr:cytochrome c [Labrenzia sp. PHM005]
MRLVKLFGGAVLAVILTSAIVFAHGGATGIVKKRMDAMEAIGGNMKLAGQMLRGQKPYDAAALRQAAETIAENAGEKLTRLFPEGSLMPPTEARPEIWQDWDKFAGFSNDMKAAASELAIKAGEGAEKGAVAAAFSKLAQTCKACHEAFRIEK